LYSHLAYKVHYIVLNGHLQARIELVSNGRLVILLVPTRLIRLTTFYKLLLFPSPIAVASSVVEFPSVLDEHRVTGNAVQLATCLLRSQQGA
jgi:hypothetical protein